MPDTPKDYGAHAYERAGPSIEFQQRLFAIVAGHPSVLEASRHVYCCPIVMLEPKAFLDGCRWDAETKERIAQHLAGTEMVAILSYHTSDTQPEPLAGHGKTYDFVIHPDTLDIIHASTGHWRS